MQAAAAPRKKRHISEIEALKYPHYVAGNYSWSEGERLVSSIPRKCDLCESRATLYFWSAPLARFLKLKLMHIFMCGRCAGLTAYRQRRAEDLCAQCGTTLGIKCTVILPDGKESKRLCSQCDAEGGHAREIREALEKIPANVRLHKSL